MLTCKWVLDRPSSTEWYRILNYLQIKNCEPQQHDVSASRSNLARNILRALCCSEVGESGVVLWLFCIQPSQNFLGMVQDSCLALEHSQHTHFFLFSLYVITLTERFLNAQTWLHLSTVLVMF